MNEAKMVVAIDNDLLAYQRLKGVDAGVIAATEARLETANEALTKAEEAAAKAQRKLDQLKQRTRFSVMLFAVFGGVILFVLAACYFVMCKKDGQDKTEQPATQEGGDDDRYVRFIDHELST